MDYINFQTFISCIIIVIIYSVYIWLYVYNGSESNKAIVYTMFVAYVFGYIYLTFLNRRIGQHTFRIDPFGDIFKSLKAGNIPYEPILNVMLYIPFGMTLPLLTTKEVCYKRAAIIGMLLSVFTETLQLITRRGEFATKDIIMNTLGAVIGLAIYKRILERI